MTDPTAASQTPSPMQRLQAMYGIVRKCQLPAELHEELFETAKILAAIILAAEDAAKPALPAPGSAAP